MMPRPPYCDGDSCDYDQQRWQHEPDCSINEVFGDDEDVVWDVAMEDGVARRQLLASVPAQTDRRAA
jgi:hypothetical protein